MGDGARTMAGETRWHTWLVLAVIVACAAVLRFWNLGQHSVWLDEAAVWLQAKDGLGEMFVRTGKDNYPPLYNLALWPVIKLFGDGEAVLRAPSAVFSTLTIGAVFLLARELAGNRAGLIAAAVLAVAPMDIAQAHNARMYTLFSLTATLYLWSAARYLRAPSRGGAAIGGLAAFAMLFSHLYGTLIFGWVSLAWNALWFAGRAQRRSGYRPWFWGQSVAFLVFLPWLVILIGRAIRIVREGFWIPEPDGDLLTEIVFDLFPAPLMIFAGLVLAAGAAAALAGRLRPGANGGVLLLAVAALGPFIAAYLLSVTLEPVMLARYFIPSVAAVVALSAVLLVRLPLPGIASWAAAGAVIAVLANPALDAMRDRGAHSDWRGLVAAWRERRAPEDHVVMVPVYAIKPFSYYARDTEPLRVDGDAVPADLTGRVWVAIRSSDPADGKAVADAWRGAGFTLEETTAFDGLQLLALRRD